MKFKQCEFWINQSGYPPIKINGFAVEFDAAERCPERFAVQYEDFFGWRATHWETGLAIGRYYDSREECAKAALARLKLNPAALALALERARGWRQPAAPIGSSMTRAAIGTKYIPGVARGCAIGWLPEWLRGTPRTMADPVSCACALRVVRRQPWWRF